MEISNKLINALISVESNGKADAIGDGGKAKGCLQIHNVVVEDVNNFFKTNYIHDDAFDMEKAKDICRKYLSHWSKYYKQQEGKEATDEVLARIWNGGPFGYRKMATMPYWNKVKVFLSEENDVQSYETMMMNCLEYSVNNKKMAHIRADKILLEIARKNGYVKVAEIFEKMKKDYQ